MSWNGISNTHPPVKKSAIGKAQYMKPILIIRSPTEQPKNIMRSINRDYHVIWIHGTYEDFSFELLSVDKAENLTDEKINELTKEINDSIRTTSKRIAVSQH